MNDKNLLFPWMEQTDVYVIQMHKLYTELLIGIDLYCGGIKNKNVLEVGSGFHLSLGGVLLAFAAQSGADSVCGIDLSLPTTLDHDQNKKLFWDTIYNKFNLPLNKHDARITELQMNVEEMSFPNNSFDLIFSNATFEHINDVNKALKECHRVLKPGGCLYIHWNPFTSLQYGAHDVGIPYYYQWPHLRLSFEDHLIKFKEVLSDQSLIESASIAGHTINKVRADKIQLNLAQSMRDMLGNLNKIRISELMSIVKNLKFDILYEEYSTYDNVEKFYTDQIQKELTDYSKEELLLHTHKIALRKLDN
jgi:SAM-dependent methyltransferase